MAFLEFVANDFMNSWQYIVRMLLAAVCGALIGMERTRKQKEAGTRTHVIVAVGAAMMMIISKYGFFDVIVVDYVQVDPSKIAAQVVLAGMQKNWVRDVLEEKIRYYGRRMKYYM